MSHLLAVAEWIINSGLAIKNSAANSGALEVPGGYAGLPTPAAQAQQLLWANACLWHLEDRVRELRADQDLTQTGNLKRSIDYWNAVRTQAINALDMHFYSDRGGLVRDGDATSARDAVLTSETVGNILDRISILSLKREALRFDPEKAAALELVEKQLMHLLQLVEQYEELYRQGRIIAPPRGIVKLYHEQFISGNETQ